MISSTNKEALERTRSSLDKKKHVKGQGPLQISMKGHGPLQLKKPR